MSEVFVSHRIVFERQRHDIPEKKTNPLPRIKKNPSLPALDFPQDLFSKERNHDTANGPRNHLTSPAHQDGPQVPSHINPRTTPGAHVPAHGRDIAPKQEVINIDPGKHGLECRIEHHQSEDRFPERNEVGMLNPDRNLVERLIEVGTTTRSATTS